MQRHDAPRGSKASPPLPLLPGHRRAVTLESRRRNGPRGPRPVRKRCIRRAGLSLLRPRCRPMTDTIAATEELKKALAAEEGARRWVRRLAIAFGVVLVVGGGLAWSSQHRPAPPPRFTTAQVAVGDVLEAVQATGTVQPLLQVNVGTQVNGRVTEVLVDYNSVVKKGDLLAEIDPLIYGTQVSANQANLSAGRAQLEQAKASALSSRAQRDIAKVTADRTEKLFEQNLASRGDLDTAKGNYEAASASYEAAMATVMSQQAAIGAQTAHAPAVDREPRVHEDLLSGRRRGRDARDRSGCDGPVELPGRGPLRHRPGPSQDADPRRRRRGRRGQDRRRDGDGLRRRRVPRRDLPRQDLPGPVQPEQRLGRRHVLGGRRRRQPRREAPAGNDDDDHRAHARGARRQPATERRLPLSADAADGTGRQADPAAARARAPEGAVARLGADERQARRREGRDADRVGRDHRRHLHRGDRPLARRRARGS